MRMSEHHSGRWAQVAMGVLFAFSLLVPQSVMAGRPPTTVGGSEGSHEPGPPPLTPDQEASVETRLAQVDALTAGLGQAGADVFCEGSDPPPCEGALPYAYTLGTHARHQHRYFYCGTAVVQVVSNYTRGYTSSNTCGGDTGCPSGTNYKDQHYISNQWTHTAAVDGTTVANLAAGLNAASVLPSGFVYAYWTNMSWISFHNALRVDAYTWRMPLAPRVSPRTPGSQYFLTSWAGQTAGSYGHWITLRGYSGTDQSYALAYYNDSSGGVDEHDPSIHILGNTGAFSDKSYTVYKTMTLRTTRINNVDYYYLVW